MFDLSINLGSVLTMGMFIVAMTAYVVNGRSAAKVLGARLSGIDGQMQEFKEEIKKLTEVLIAQALMVGRVERAEDRQIAEGKRLDALQKEVVAWTSVNGVYETRHRDLENRVRTVESVCKRLHE